MEQLDQYEQADYTEKEKAVIKMAELMAHNSSATLDDVTVGRMRQYLSESELVEIGFYFALVTGMQKFNNVFQVYYGNEDCKIPTS